MACLRGNGIAKHTIIFYDISRLELHIEIPLGGSLWASRGHEGLVSNNDSKKQISSVRIEKHMIHILFYFFIFIFFFFFFFFSYPFADIIIRKCKICCDSCLLFETSLIHVLKVMSVDLRRWIKFRFLNLFYAW